LGLLREDKALTNRFLRSHASIESIRKQIEGRTTIRDKVSTSVDLPLSPECKRVLQYAAEEAERLSHKHIGTEHLLLGLLREEKSFAAEILHERGLRLSQVREEIQRSSSEKVASNRPKESSLLAEFSRDLTQAAMDGSLDPLIGRDYELERVVQILCRRTKNNPVLIGEPGVGETTPAEYRKSIEKDRSLERRFQAVKVPPPTESDAIRILFGIKERYEKFHAVAYTDEAVESAVHTSTRFIPDRFLPDKAID